MDTLSELPSGIDLASFRDKWISIGLSTEPIDKDKAIDSINRAYASASLCQPRHYLWLPSPLHGTIASAILPRPKQKDKIRDQIRHEELRDSGGWNHYWKEKWRQDGYLVKDCVDEDIRNLVKDEVRVPVRERVWAQGWKQTREQLWKEDWDAVREQCWEDVRDQVREKIGDQDWEDDWDDARDQTWDQIGQACYGAHDADWLSYYDVLCACHVPVAERLTPLMDVAQHVGWWWPRIDVCIVTPRVTPERITD
jgi:hypothetical protein